MKKLVRFLLILAAIALPLFWFFYPLRSLIVMSVYSAQQSGESVMRKSGFSIDIPSGEGWYPFVMTYNAPGFREWSGIDAEMSILYNFGAFDLAARTSTIYDTGSGKYSAFYGAYVVNEREGAFGFKGGILDISEMAEAVEYDYTVLVMSAFGCEDHVFEAGDYSVEKGAHIAGSGGWTRVNALITANGCAHNYKSDKTPYLQYGRPMKEVIEDFAVIKLFGRVYAKHFEEYGCTVMLYAIAPDKSEIEKCDRDLLRKAKITGLYQSSYLVSRDIDKLL